MALGGVNLSSAIRTLAEREGLVAAIHGASSSEQETDWVEWKSSYDLSAKEDQFKLAKHILGFANRVPDRVVAFVGGCAYLVCGVEPANCQGVAPIDAAVLTRGIGRYTGTGPRWNADYVAFQGKQVLVITVEPPTWGEQIHTLQQAYTDGSLGTIYVRRNGLTEQANPSEILALSERYARKRTQVSLAVGWNGDQPEVVCYDAGDLAMAAWLEAERELLLRYLASYQPASGGTGAAFMSVLGETRKPAEYRQEVENYLASARKSFPYRMRWLAARHGKPLSLLVENSTDQNFEAVEVEVLIPGTVHAFFDLESARHRLHADQFLRRPRKYGDGIPSLIPDLGSITSALGGAAPVRRGSIDNSGSARIDFAAVDVRPRSSPLLPTFLVVADRALAGQVLTMTWSLTAKNADGRREGELALAVSSAPLAV